MQQLMVLVFSLFVLSGCASMDVYSVKDNSFSATLERVHVLIIPPQKGEYYAGAEDFERNYLKGAFDELLVANGIQHQVTVVTGLELDKNWLSKIENNFKPDSRLVIQPKKITRYSNGVQWITYNASVITLPGRKRVWRAESVLRLSAFSGSPEKNSRVLATELLKKMNHDSLFEGGFADPEEKG